MSSILENVDESWPEKFLEASQEIGNLHKNGIPDEMISLLSNELVTLKEVYQKIITHEHLDAESTLQTEWPKFARKLSDEIVTVQESD